MLGTYRHVRDGNINFYEFLAIEGDDHSLVLRLKHFDPGLLGWEEKEEVMAFPLVDMGDRRAYFDGFTFLQPGESQLQVHLRMERDGELREQVFHYGRISGKPA